MDSLIGIMNKDFLICWGCFSEKSMEMEPPWILMVP